MPWDRVKRATKEMQDGNGELGMVLRETRQSTSTLGSRDGCRGERTRFTTRIGSNSASLKTK